MGLLLLFPVPRLEREIGWGCANRRFSAQMSRMPPEFLWWVAAVIAVFVVVAAVIVIIMVVAVVIAAAAAVAVAVVIVVVMVVAAAVVMMVVIHGAVYGHFGPMCGRMALSPCHYQNLPSNACL